MSRVSCRQALHCHAPQQHRPNAVPGVSGTYVKVLASVEVIRDQALASSDHLRGERTVQVTCWPVLGSPMRSCVSLPWISTIRGPSAIMTRPFWFTCAPTDTCHASVVALPEEEHFLFWQ